MMMMMMDIDRADLDDQITALVNVNLKPDPDKHASNAPYAKYASELFLMRTFSAQRANQYLWRAPFRHLPKSP